MRYVARDTLVKDCGGFVVGVIYRVTPGHVDTARILLMPVKLPLNADDDLTGLCNVGDKLIRFMFPRLGKYTHHVWRVL